MNMRKYASYKQAAKRIIRLMEKRAEGEEGLSALAAEAKKPGTTRTAFTGDGRFVSVDRGRLSGTPEFGGWLVESNENYDLSKNPPKPTIPPLNLWPFTMYARQRDALNAKNWQLQQKRNQKTQK